MKPQAKAAAQRKLAAKHHKRGTAVHTLPATAAPQAQANAATHPSHPVHPTHPAHPVAKPHPAKTKTTKKPHAVKPHPAKPHAVKPAQQPKPPKPPKQAPASGQGHSKK